MQPTREQIITSLWESADLKAAIRKTEHAHLWDDLRQEIFLVLCEMDAARLESLWAEGKLNMFIFRMMWNMVTRDRSAFNQYHRKFTETITVEPESIPDQQNGTHLFENLEPAIEELDPYEAGLITLYADMGRDCRPVANATGIKIRSVRYAVTAAKEKLKKKLKAHVD